MNATEVGKYFYCKDRELSEIQIQKLTYYAYAWSLALRDEKIFEERPQAWIHGPVFRSLYDSMKKREFYETDISELNICDKIQSLLEMIYTLYGKCSSNELEQMTHSEDPWQNARIGYKPNERSTEELSDKDISEYYKGLLTSE